jgi:hypothetical protein
MDTAIPLIYRCPAGSNHSAGSKSSVRVRCCGHLLAAFETESTKNPQLLALSWQSGPNLEYEKVCREDREVTAKKSLTTKLK